MSSHVDILQHNFYNDHDSYRNMVWILPDKECINTIIQIQFSSESKMSSKLLFLAVLLTVVTVAYSLQCYYGEYLNWCNIFFQRTHQFYNVLKQSVEWKCLHECKYF